MLASFQTTCTPSFSKPHHNLFLLTHKPYFITFLHLKPIAFTCFAKTHLKGGLQGEKEGLVNFNDPNADKDEEEEGEDEEEVIVPLANMKVWMENKPSGFGEKKVYVTEVEDKLMEEIEQSRVAQAANINNLKHNPISPNGGLKKKKKEAKVVSKAPEVVVSGSRVRVSNLPKKRNIHRDLQMAFTEFPRLLNIIPAVSGTKKTRDPTCKGFAFVDLGSAEDANRFVKAYTKQRVTFGKIQKEITCEIANPDHLSNSVQGFQISTPSLKLPLMKDDSDEELVDVNSIITSPKKVTVLDDEPLPATFIEVAEEGVEHLILSDENEDEDDKLRSIFTDKLDSARPKKQKKSQNTEKKRIVKDKSEKVPKLKIPGSAKRLRTTEKSLLTDAFAKYGVR